MVTRQSVPVFDGDLGGTVECGRYCIDDRRCPLSVLQLVSYNSSRTLEPMATDYDRLISVVCTIAIACSLGEIASIYPTAGGMPRISRHLLSRH
jgi:hypothetical protein